MKSVTALFALASLVQLSCGGAAALSPSETASHGKPTALTAASAAGSPHANAPAPAARDDGQSDGFEGEIDLDVQSMKYFFQLKGRRLRVLPDPTSTAIQELSVVDCVRHREYTIFQDKQYTGGPTPDTGASCPAAEPSEGWSGPPPPQALKPMGKTDTVAGYRCDLYKATRVGVPGFQEICISSELAATFNDLPPRIVGYFVDFWGARGFELRVRSYDEKGALVWTDAVTRLEKKHIPLEAFDLPPGSTQFTPRY